MSMPKFKRYTTYNEVTNTFPYTIQSSGGGIDNYSIYGKTENISGIDVGVGEVTENLFDFADAVPRKYIDANGIEQNSAATDDYIATSHSGYMAVTPNENYTFKAKLKRITILDHYITFCWFDSSKTFISRDVNHNTQQYITTYQYTGTAPANATFCIMNFTGYDNESKFMFVPGSTPPDHYIPYGYSIPLMNTDVVTENLWDNDDFWDNGHASSLNSNMFGYAYNVSPGTYTASTNVIDNVDTSIASVFVIAAPPNQDPTISSSNNGVFINRPRTVTVGENQALWIMIRRAVSPPQDYLIWNKETFSNYWIMLNAGPTALPYVPHHYESNYDLFIGNSQLYENEYLDYEEQRIYKRTENLVPPIRTANGWKQGYRYKSNGRYTSTHNSGEWLYDVYIPIDSTSFTFWATSVSGTASGTFYFFDNNKDYLTNTAIDIDNYNNAVISDLPANATYMQFAFRTYYKSEQEIIDNNYQTMLTKDSTAPASYIPYLQATDPPVPFPAITTEAGYNNIDINTSIKPTALTLTYKGWR